MRSSEEVAKNLKRAGADKTTSNGCGETLACRVEPKLESVCHLEKCCSGRMSLTGGENRGRSSMVELQPSKLVVWVRFPSPAFQGIEDRLAAAVAQLVERFLGKDEVMGSSPISSFWRRSAPLSASQASREV